MLRTSLLTVLAPLLALGVLRAAECRSTRFHERTDDFAFTATSEEGVTGDIVAVEIGLRVEALHERLAEVRAVGCYDGEVAELVGYEFSPRSESLSYQRDFWALDGSTTPARAGGGSGFILSLQVRAEETAELLSRAGPIPLATLYLRLVAPAPAETAIEFCDETFFYPQQAEVCERNHLYYLPLDAPQLFALSGLHEPGRLRIEEGEPTRTEIPELPPRAEAYPDLPTPEEARVRFELTGGVVIPDGSETSLDLFVTSAIEYSGYSITLEFLPRELEIVDVEEPGPPGEVQIDPIRGMFGLFLRDARRRLAPAGERWHVATLRVRARPEATGGGEVAPRFGPTLSADNRIFIHHRAGRPDGPAQLAAIRPLRNWSAPLVVQILATRSGDVDLDHRLSIADAITLLGRLFLGEDRIVCRAASDFNGDGNVDISDAVGILGFLFRGGRGPAEEELWCR